MKFCYRLWYENFEGLTHVDVRVGSIGGPASKWCGSFTMTTEQFEEFQRRLDRHGVEFIEKPNFRFGGDCGRNDESLWIRALRKIGRG